MAPRRTHKKSRAGCAKCKKRRIKCDEVRPECGNCVKHAIVCDYSLPPEDGEKSSGSGGEQLLHYKPVAGGPPPAAVSLPTPTARLHPGHAISPATTVTSPHPSSVSSPPPPPPQFAATSPSPQFAAPLGPPPTPATSGLNMTDLALMHHWTLSTSLTISTTPTVQRLWRENITLLATRHDFLMHGLLAISALHLHTIHPSPHLLPHAATHHDKAVRSMSATLPHINRTNCDALVTASCFVVIYSFVSSRSSDHIAAWVPLLRGVHSIIKQAWPWVTGGPLTPLIQQYELSPHNNPDLDDSTDKVLSALFRLCTDHSLPDAHEIVDTETSTAYFSAVAELRKSFATISRWESVIGSIFVWPITASDKFVELLVGRRARALVIYIHYCALFTLVEDFWWSEGSAEEELRRCEECLGQEWASWIEWPRERILGRDVETMLTSKTGDAAAAAAAAAAAPPPSSLPPLSSLQQPPLPSIPLPCSLPPSPPSLPPRPPLPASASSLRDSNVEVVQPPPVVP